MLMSAFGSGGAAQAASGLGADASPVSSPWTDPGSAGFDGGAKAPAESGWGQDAAPATQDAWGAQDDGGDWGGEEEI